MTVLDRSNRLRSSAVFVAALCLSTIFACSAATPNNVSYRPGRFEFDWPRHAALTPRIRGSVNERLLRDTELLVVKLQDIAVTTAVARANSLSTPSLEMLMQIDQEWRTAMTQSPVVASRTDAACSRSLGLLIDEGSDFVEILVTDSRGLVVCQSRMTARFYLGDQNWWRECVEGGRLSHSRLVYDRDSDTLALSIFAPVLDPSTRESIGVARAVVRRRARTR